MKLFSTAFMAALLVGASVASAGIVTDNLFYDGGNKTAATHDYNTGTLTDAGTGIEFEAVITITAAGGDLKTNGGTSDREWGVTGGNNAIDTAGESITATLTSITITNDNGFGGAANVTFDGFTDILLYFVGNDGDAGKVTDGTSALFQWEGTLDPGGADFGDTVISVGSGLQTYGESGESAVSVNNARIDVSGTLPSTLVAEFVAHSGGGATAPADPNRWRIDDLGVQFTVTPEPASLALLGLGGLMVLRRRQ